MHPTSDTAILIFSRRAAEEAVCKDFVGNRKQNLFIASQLIAKTRKTAKATGIPVVSRFSTHQQGNSFGERFTNAIEAVFTLGFKKVITIGTDSPDLSTESILNVADLLNHQHMVAGPSADGGIYILGISKEAYQRSSFLKIPWQTSKVQAALQEVNASMLTGLYALLPILQDIDSRFDFNIWLNAASWLNPLKQCLLLLLRGNEQPARPAVISQQFINQELSRRGPPRVVAA